MCHSHIHLHRTERRGAAAVFTLVTSAVLVGFAALAIDVGMLYCAKAELQRAADAAAMAGASRLLDSDRLKGPQAATAGIEAARHEARALVALNFVQGESLSVPSADIVIGRLRNPSDPNEAISFADPMLFNAVQVLVRRDSVANGPVGLWFAQVFGRRSADVTATATAAMADGLIGYRVTTATGNADILPLTLHVDAWRALVNRTGVVSDDYTYDPASDTITSGADGIAEMNLYPGAGTGQLPPGNFGTVNIGPSNNSTKHLSDQIRYGVTADDLSHYGGELKLGPDGTLVLNGDTGLSAAIKDDLTAIEGLPRAIPLFRSVSGNGNNANYTIVGFAGVRILNVKLTGSMKSKRVIIQPAFVVDDAAITGTTDSISYFVYQPVHLIR